MVVVEWAGQRFVACDFATAMPELKVEKGPLMADSEMRVEFMARPLTEYAQRPFRRVYPLSEPLGVFNAASGGWTTNIQMPRRCEVELNANGDLVSATCDEYRRRGTCEHVRHAVRDWHQERRESAAAIVNNDLEDLARRIYEAKIGSGNLAAHVSRSAETITASQIRAWREQLERDQREKEENERRERIAWTAEQVQRMFAQMRGFHLPVATHSKPTAVPAVKPEIAPVEEPVRAPRRFGF